MRVGGRSQRLPLAEIDQCRIHAGNLGALLENTAVAEDNDSCGGADFIQRQQFCRQFRADACRVTHHEGNARKF